MSEEYLFKILELVKDINSDSIKLWREVFEILTIENGDNNNFTTNKNCVFFDIKTIPRKILNKLYDYLVSYDQRRTLFNNKEQERKEIVSKINEESKQLCINKIKNDLRMSQEFFTELSSINENCKNYDNLSNEKDYSKEYIEAYTEVYTTEVYTTDKAKDPVYKYSEEEKSKSFQSKSDYELNSEYESNSDYELNSETRSNSDSEINLGLGSESEESV